ncbi:hypothetical protein F2Q69_00029475 [Brassica cretica]|uniref:Uncharacterized protein n=1 Tax=Brassica cretica TaxID=69181 RepID=A0A8S9RWI2_BRACR|nr:hypothetical protein F2Q69_00029475 [Brassica cretica]
MTIVMELEPQYPLIWLWSRKVERRWVVIWSWLDGKISMFMLLWSSISLSLRLAVVGSQQSNIASAQALSHRYHRYVHHVPYGRHNPSVFELKY